MIKLKFSDDGKLHAIEKSQDIDLRDMLEDGEEWTEYCMAPLSKHSPLFIKSSSRGIPKTFHESLLQVAGKSKIRVINLDYATTTEEVATIERSYLFVDPENYVETPIESSRIVQSYSLGMGDFEIASNFDNTMRASKGAIHRMFSQIDLNQLKRIFNEVASNAKEISDIDLTTTTRQFGDK